MSGDQLNRPPRAYPPGRHHDVLATSAHPQEAGLLDQPKLRERLFDQRNLRFHLLYDTPMLWESSKQGSKPKSETARL